MRACETGRLTGRVLIEEGVLTIGIDSEGTLLLAMAEPTNLLALDDVTMLTGTRARPIVASYEDIRALLRRLDGADWPAVDTDAAEGNSPAEVAEHEVTRLHASAQDGPVVRLVDSILSRAIHRGASDIHFDPGPDDMQVHFRVDGLLASAASVPRRLAPGVVSRLKIMGALDIAERRAPQDGRTSLLVEERPIDLRIVTLPVVHGEAVVVRVLDPGAAPKGPRISAWAMRSARRSSPPWVVRTAAGSSPGRRGPASRRRSTRRSLI